MDPSTYNFPFSSADDGNDEYAEFSERHGIAILRPDHQTNKAAGAKYNGHVHNINLLLPEFVKTDENFDGRSVTSESFAEGFLRFEVASMLTKELLGAFWALHRLASHQVATKESHLTRLGFGSGRKAKTDEKIVDAFAKICTIQKALEGEETIKGLETSALLPQID